MSFMEKYAEDEALQAKLEGKSADEVKAIAAEMGYGFTTDELKEFGKNMTKLSPDELEAASGGSGDEQTPEMIADKIAANASDAMKQAGAEWALSDPTGARKN